MFKLYSISIVEGNGIWVYPFTFDIRSQICIEYRVLALKNCRTTKDIKLLVLILLLLEVLSHSIQILQEDYRRVCNTDISCPRGINNHKNGLYRVSFIKNCFIAAFTIWIKNTSVYSLKYFNRPPNFPSSFIWTVR